ncbi:hypothetical protein DSO57_1019253 [Entomophthora muscae]|uniref:Uncharacterized protein n=1 Tax=Entomophthora muscae TaxID=34485 RepID=A0ACC2UDX2_9FUNG|nr:hypothetical protein DSO57_1019253 [Entomophthora muscae]
MAEEGVIEGIGLFLSHKGKGRKKIKNLLGFFSSFRVDQLLKFRALLEAAAECLSEVEVASLRGALEDSNEGIRLSLFEIHYQIFVIRKAFCLLPGWGGFLFLGLGLLLAPSSFLGLVRICPDTSCVTKMPWENSTILHNPNASLMTLLVSGIFLT